jgi:putative DNA primase/helicase
MNDVSDDFDIADMIEAAEPVDPSEVGNSTFPKVEDRPCWGVYDDWVVKPSGKKARPGLYWHSMSKATNEQPSMPTDTWVSGPVHKEALTQDGDGLNFGLLLRFTDRSAKSRLWAMPFEMLAGSGEEPRRELMSMGLAISYDHKAMLSRYLLDRTPKRSVLCTSTTGWVGRTAFVLPDGVIGPGAGSVVFQDGGRVGKGHGQAGTLDSWRDTVSRYAIGNPFMTFGIACAFVPPLLDRTHTEGGGVHLVGGSSSGKTTMLEGARSVWGGRDFKRSWRATDNGVEGVAEQHNDLLLCMDEINEVEPRVAGNIAYMLTNGVGKSRAMRNGGSRPPKRWRTFPLSTGEQSLEATMQEGRVKTKAGQSIRLLDMRVDNRKHGCFDELHGLKNGRAFSDAVKRAANENYGVVGRAFLERLTRDDTDFGELLDDAKNVKGLTGQGGQEERAAARCALIGLAGEVATEYGLTGWPAGASMDAAVIAFNAWRDFRGSTPGDQEPRKIREAIRDFIERHGESRFVDAEASPELRDSMERHIRDKAGYRKSTFEDGRNYYFNAAAIKEACPGYDVSAMIDALTACGALIPATNGKAQQQLKVGGINGKFYVINPDRLEG